MNVIRNIIMAVATAVPVGTVVGTTMTPINLPTPTPIQLSTGPTVVTPSPNPFTSPTSFVPPPSGGGSGAGGSSSSGVIVDLLTQPSLCDPGELDVFATTDIRTNVTNYRISIGKAVTENGALDALAATDTITFINEVIPNTTIFGKTITQRVKLALPKSKAAAEIVVKGCFPTGNTPNQILALINTNPPNPTTQAILNNPNWTDFGAVESTSVGLAFGGGVVYTIIFAQQ